MPAQQYRKKPVTIEAAQFKTWSDAIAICGWADAYYVPAGAEHGMRHDHEFDKGNGHVRDTAPPFLVVKTLEGPVRASVGDWVIRGVHGEFYPCKPDIFEATYDSIDQERG